MPKKILLVDDAPVTVTMIKRQLDNAGYDVVTANNGQEGLKIVANTPVDLIITDIYMPVMDGVDFYRELQKNSRTAKIPVIVITDSVVIQESFRALGVNDFIAKPTEGKDILEKVERLLSLIGSIQYDAKVLIAGNDRATLKEMALLLEHTGFNVTIAPNGMEALTLAVKLVPRFFIVDILIHDLPAKEIIRAMQCFIKLKSMKILTYTQFSPEEISDINLVNQLKDAKDACLEAGASKYLGRFSRSTFIENMPGFSA
ncbi:MAG: response regulator [Candidatus Omnitrophica bacterium]|nr:response regulator [Candidatus Omnitrophota bacterium]